MLRASRPQARVRRPLFESYSALRSERYDLPKRAWLQCAEFLLSISLFLRLARLLVERWSIRRGNPRGGGLRIGARGALPLKFLNAHHDTTTGLRRRTGRRPGAAALPAQLFLLGNAARFCSLKKVMASLRSIAKKPRAAASTSGIEYWVGPWSSTLKRFSATMSGATASFR